MAEKMYRMDDKGYAKAPKDPLENMSDEELEQLSMDDIFRAVIVAQAIDKSVKKGEKENEQN